MKFAKIVFCIAAIWGVLILAPLYFIFDKIGQQDPPPITHPGFYYGFAAVALAWQVVFAVIARDPARFRLMMIPGVLEKFAYGASLLVLYGSIACTGRRGVRRGRCPVRRTVLACVLSNLRLTVPVHRTPGAPFLARSVREKACPELVEGSGFSIARNRSRPAAPQLIYDACMMNRRAFVKWANLAGLAAGLPASSAFGSTADDPKSRPAVSATKAPASPETILLKDYRPISIYKIPVSQIAKAKFPIIDMHSHPYAKTAREIDEWVGNMDEVGVEKTIILAMATGAEFDEIYRKYSKHPDRFEMWCGFDFWVPTSPGSVRSRSEGTGALPAGGSPGCG